MRAELAAATFMADGAFKTAAGKMPRAFRPFAEVGMRWMGRVLLVSLAGCSEGDGVIRETPPFASTSAPLAPEASDAFVTRSERFAAERRMRIEVNRDHLRDGEFSILVIGDDLNITATNTVTRGQVDMDAIARRPTDGKSRAFEDYVEHVSTNRI